MRKGHTVALSVTVKEKRAKRKLFSQLKDMSLCMEYYYNSRHLYTGAELNTLDSAFNYLKSKAFK